MFCSVLLLHVLAHAQGAQVPGHPIGKVTTDGDLIVLELDQGALGKTNLFDLAGRTLVFIPEGAGYRVENRALEWDADFGQKITEPRVALHKFSFPFSGKNWDAFTVGVAGSIRFGERYRLDVIAEGFNLFNRFNEAAASPFFDDVNAFAQRASNGRYFSRPTAAYDPRQFQFGLKLYF